MNLLCKIFGHRYPLLVSPFSAIMSELLGKKFSYERAKCTCERCGYFNEVCFSKLITEGNFVVGKGCDDE